MDWSPSAFVLASAPRSDRAPSGQLACHGADLAPVWSLARQRLEIREKRLSSCQHAAEVTGGGAKNLPSYAAVCGESHAKVAVRDRRCDAKASEFPGHRHFPRCRSIGPGAVARTTRQPRVHAGHRPAHLGRSGRLRSAASLSTRPAPKRKSARLARPTRAALFFQLISRRDERPRHPHLQSQLRQVGRRLPGPGDRHGHPRPAPAPRTIRPVRGRGDGAERTIRRATWGRCNEHHWGKTGDR
jgi:hypothetical protein